MMNKPCRRPEGRGPSARYSVHSLPLSSSASPPYLPFGGGQLSTANMARNLAQRLHRRHEKPPAVSRNTSWLIADPQKLSDLSNLSMFYTSLRARKNNKDIFPNTYGNMGKLDKSDNSPYRHQTQMPLNRSLAHP